MSPIDAEDLAQRIVRAFRLAPPPDVWEPVLLDLHRSQAHATLQKLTKEHDASSLQPAVFLRTYHSFKRPTPAQTLTVCSLCDDTGSIVVTDARRHRKWCKQPDHDYERNLCGCPDVVERCKCPADAQVPRPNDRPVSLPWHLAELERRAAFGSDPEAAADLAEWSTPFAQRMSRIIIEGDDGQ